MIGYCLEGRASNGLVELADQRTIWLRAFSIAMYV